MVGHENIKQTTKAPLEKLTYHQPRIPCWGLLLSVKGYLVCYYRYIRYYRYTIGYFVTSVTPRYKNVTKNPVFVATVTSF